MSARGCEFCDRKRVGNTRPLSDGGHPTPGPGHRDIVGQTRTRNAAGADATASLGGSALLMVEAREARRAPQLPPESVLATRHVERLPEAPLGLSGRRRLAP